MTAPQRFMVWAVPLTVLMLAAGIRLLDLSEPRQLYWDEQYYVFDAEAYLGGGIGQPIAGAPPVKITDEGTWVHPPVGKWMIALLGVGPLGLRPIGWRLPSALFGILGVGLVYLLALQLWESVCWAGLASLLLALDGLHIVQSRIAMLDIFLTTFVTAGILLLVLDRRRMDSVGDRERSQRKIDRFFGSPYRLGAGAALGAAVATKWSGAFALAFCAVLATAWLMTGDRRGERSRLGALGTVAASFLLVPTLVYLVSYGQFVTEHGVAAHDFITLQARMLDYQLHHSRVQPQNSSPWTWPLLLQPIQYFGVARGDSIRRIVALGNPALWWGFLAIVPVALVQIVRRPRWQEAVTFGGYLSMYAPWLFVGRTQFIFYMLPAVPFMCLCVAGTLRRLPPALAQAAGVAFAAIASFVASLFGGAWLGLWLPRSFADGLRWLPRWPL